VNERGYFDTRARPGGIIKYQEAFGAGGLFKVGAPWFALLEFDLV
jgi:hypothetical protein